MHDVRTDDAWSVGRYINAILMRAASKMSRLVARVRTINLNRPPDAGRERPDVKQLPSGCQETTVRTFHTETSEN